MPMARATCDYGHEAQLSTTDWVAQMDVDQKRFALGLLEKEIKKIDEAPKRTVWRVCIGGACEGNYREEEYEKAADHLLRIFKDRFMEEARDFLAKPYGWMRFTEELPHVTPERVSQIEYETVWFPTAGAQP